MGAERPTPSPRRIRTRLAWAVSLPAAATLVAIAAFAAASSRADAMYEQALLWSRHLVALHELEVAAHAYVDEVERAVTPGAPGIPAPPPVGSGARLVEAAAATRALSQRFERQEREEEEALHRAVERLAARGQEALRRGSGDGLGALADAYRGEVLPRIADRIRDEEAGGRDAILRARRGSHALLAAAALLSFALVAAAGWRSWRLARHLGRRVGLLRDGARRISEGDLEHPLALPPDDELGEVAAAFDRMAEALRANLDELRAAHDQLVASERMAAIGVLAAEVAHEVNSPLAFIRSNVAYALAVMGDPHRTPADEAEAVAALREAYHGAEQVRDVVRALGGNVLVTRAREPAG